MAEQVDEAAGRPQRQEQQAQQRGLAGAGGAGEELKGMRGDLKTEVAQNLRTQTVAQADVFEADHASAPFEGTRGAAGTRLSGRGARPRLCGVYGFRFVNG